MRCLRGKSFLTYFFVGSGTFALDAYYSTHSPSFFENRGISCIERCLYLYYSPNFYRVCAIDDFIFCANIKKVLDLLCRVVYQSKRSIDDAYRGIAQLVEHRSPKPSVEGSNPSAPANNQRAVRKGGSFLFFINSLIEFVMLYNIISLFHC